MVLARIETLCFPTHIVISKKRRIVYYKKKDDVPKKYKNSLADKNGFLLDKEGNRIVKNKRTAGTPKIEKMSGNSLLTGYSTPHMRTRISNELKDYFRPFVKKAIREFGLIKKFPIRIEWEVYTTVDNPVWDLSNLFFYYKYFEDTLHREGMIPDDNIKYVTHSPGPKLIPVDDWEKRKFIFTIHDDSRRELCREPWETNAIGGIGTGS